MIVTFLANQVFLSTRFLRQAQDERKSYTSPARGELVEPFEQGIRRNRIVYLLLLLSTLMQAQTTQELFLQANTHYEHKEYQKALDIYKKIEPKGAATWYNMGNCAYKLADYTNALLFWQRSQANASSKIYADSRINSTHAYRQLGAVENSTAHPVGQKITDRIMQSAPLLILQIIFFFLFSVFLISNYYFLRKKRYIFFLLGSLTLFSMSVATFAFYKNTRSPMALITQDNARMFVGPNQEYDQISAVPLGAQVKIITHKNSWNKIKYAAHEGWIPDTMIEHI